MEAVQAPPPATQRCAAARSRAAATAPVDVPSANRRALLERFAARRRTTFSAARSECPATDRSHDRPPVTPVTGAETHNIEKSAGRCEAQLGPAFALAPPEVERHGDHQGRMDVRGSGGDRRRVRRRAGGKRQRQGRRRRRRRHRRASFLGRRRVRHERREPLARRLCREHDGHRDTGRQFGRPRWRGRSDRLLPCTRQRLRWERRVLQRRLRQRRVRLSAVHFGWVGVRSQRQLLQPDMHERDMRHLEHGVPHARKHVRSERRLLLEPVHGRHLPAVVLLRSGRRRLCRRRRLLHRRLHHRCGKDPWHVRRVAAGRARELRRGRRSAVRRDGHERAGGRTRGWIAGVRRTLLQPCVRAVGPERSSRVPAGQRLSRRR